MNEELETMINIYKDLKEHKQLIANINVDFFFKFAETVLQALDNSIPKEKIEKVFETKIYNTNYLAETDWADYQREVDLRVAELLKVIKQELLEER